MPLLVPPEPAIRCVLTALSSPTAVREDRTPALRHLPGPFTPEQPLPVHVLERMTPRSGPPHIRLDGWRFLIHTGGRAVAAADTMLTPDGWVFSHFFEGPYVASTDRALKQAEAHMGAYQPRLLSVPELYMVSLWLHGDTSTDPAEGRPAPTDLLVPLAPAPPGIAAHRPHRAGDLLPMLSLRLTPSASLLRFPA